MALIKEKLTKFGVTANYWRIRSVSINHHAKQALITVDLLLDEKQHVPLETKNYTVTDPSFVFTTKNMVEANYVQLAYEFIRATDPDLSGAVND